MSIEFQHKILGLIGGFNGRGGEVRRANLRLIPYKHRASLERAIKRFFQEILKAKGDLREEETFSVDQQGRREKGREWETRIGGRWGGFY